MARSVFFRNFTQNSEKELNRILEEINAEMIGEIHDVDNYLTSIILRFTGNSVEYVNAAHTDLLVRRGSTGKVEIINLEKDDIKGLYLGMSISERPYAAMKFKVAKDDCILLYSDCITESHSPDGVQYGYERLIKTFELARGGPAEGIRDAIFGDL